ncbi:hypothetical protein BIU97_10320 [Curtobacterium sp. MCBA15_009]|nr:hypothetical protein BIU97_10320 [Curtobacterium sp. MCBA15_009]
MPIAIFSVLVLAILLLPFIAKLRSNPARDAELRARMLREQAERELALDAEKERLRGERGGAQ